MKKINVKSMPAASSNYPLVQAGDGESQMELLVKFAMDTHVKPVQLIGSCGELCSAEGLNHL